MQIHARSGINSYPYLIEFTRFANDKKEKNFRLILGSNYLFDIEYIHKQETKSNSIEDLDEKKLI